MNAEKLKQLQEQVRIGGKGSVRRKKKIIVREYSSEERKMQSALKKIGLGEIPCIDEVLIYKYDGQVICFSNPKLMAIPSANTYAVIGHAEIRKRCDFMIPYPGMSYEQWSRLTAYVSKQRGSISDNYLDALIHGVYGESDDAQGDYYYDDGDEVPDLVESFEEALCEGTTK